MQLQTEMDDSVEGPSAAKKQKIEDRGSLRKWNGAVTYRRLAKIALLVFVLPHSNAAEERVFSMVTKNKTALDPVSSLMRHCLVSLPSNLLIQSHASSMSQQVLFWKLLKGLRWSCIAARANYICR